MKKLLHLRLHRSWSILLQSVSGASRSLFLISLIASGLAHAQTLPDQDLSLEILPTGEKLLHWTGHPALTYFLQASPNLQDWTWAPNIEPGIDGSMSYEVDGPTTAGFFRLQYTDQAPAPGETVSSADYDGDGLTNLREITPRPRPGGVPIGVNLSPNIQTNPLRKDTDGDGLDDKWEEENGLDPTDDGSRDINNGPNGDPDGDGSNNLKEQSAKTNPRDAADFPVQMVIAAQSADGTGTLSGGGEFPSLSSINQAAFWFTPSTEALTIPGQDFSVAILEQKSSLRPFPTLPTNSQVNQDGLVVTPLGATMALSHFTTDSNGYHGTGLMVRDRIWILAPPRPERRDYPFLKIIETAKAVDVEEPTTTITSGVVTLTTEPNEIYSSFHDLFSSPISEAGKTVTIASRLLPIEIVDSKNDRASQLKVAKMIEFGVINQNRAIIPDNDRDCFCIRIKGAARFGPISVKVGTADNPEPAKYDDDPTQIDLHADGDDMVSDTQLLVADDEDDLEPIGGVADDQPNDRTHKIQLGGNFVISAVKVGIDPWMAIELKTPVKVVKTVQVNAVILYDRPLADGGVPTVPIDTVKSYFKIANERYAQVGVKLDLIGPVLSDPPYGVDLSDGLTVIPGVNNPAICPETANILDHLGTSSNGDIHVFFVNSLNTLHGVDPVGIAFCAFRYPDDLNHTYNAFVGADLLGLPTFSTNSYGGYVVAHELGHLLRNAGHVNNDMAIPKIQLMMEGALSDDGILGSKRFRTADENIIQNDPHAK